MKQNICYSLLFALLIFSSPSLAAPGADVKILSNMWATMKKQLDSMKSELEAMKVANDQMLQAKGLLADLKSEYEFVKGFNPEAERKKILGGVDDLTNLNELANANNFEQRYALLAGEVNKRFKAEPKKAGKAGPMEARFIKQLSDMARLEAELELYRKQALSLDPEATDKDLQWQIASSTSMTASLLLEQRIKEMEKDIARRERVLNGVQWDGQFTNYLQGTVK